MDGGTAWAIMSLVVLLLLLAISQKLMLKRLDRLEDLAEQSDDFSSKGVAVCPHHGDAKEGNPR